MPTPFHLRQQQRDEERRAAADLSDQLRRARCPECNQPLLWHDGPENDAAPGMDCDLTQEQVLERINTKHV